MYRKANKIHFNSLLTLLLLEFVLFYLSIYIVIGAGIVDKVIIDNSLSNGFTIVYFAVVFSLLMTACMSVFGLYSKKLTTYFSDTMLKIFQVFLAATFILVFSNYISTDISLNFWLVSATILVSFICILFTRTLYQKVIDADLDKLKSEAMINKRV